MKITAIELLRLRVPFSAGTDTREHPAIARADDRFNAASPRHSAMESLIVQVHTDCGLTGWGEAFGHGSNPVTFAALQQVIAPMFIGLDLADREAALEAARKAVHGFGSTGPMVYGLSGIDIALWDLAAQAAGQPLWQFLGGELRELELYASLVSYGNDPATVGYHVGRARQAGFTKVKLHETQYPAVLAARQALPASEGQLMVDVNCPWGESEASQVARDWRELGLAWLEEPVWPPDDAHALAQVRRQGTRLSAGENAAGVEGIQALLDHQAVDVIQPSVAKVGGITAMLEVFKRAQRTGTNVVPHCFYFGPGLLAVAHLCTLLPADVPVEVPFIEFEALLYPELAFTPRLRLPERPGLGFAPDAQVLQRYRIDHARVG